MKFVLLISLICVFTLTPCFSQDEDELEWVEKYFPLALKELLPIDGGMGSFIGFRSHRDLYNNVLEYSFQLEKDYSTYNVAAVFRMAESVSLFDQMLALHRKDPSITFEVMKGQLKVKVSRFTQSQCPVIGSLFKDYSRIRFRAPAGDEVYLHPFIFEFQTSSLAGDMTLTHFDSKNELVIWAMKAKRELTACVEKDQSKVKQ